jgi:hypothetical protein
LHWVAEGNGGLIAVMSIARVPKLLAPHQRPSALGYLTNCYTLPQFRRCGIGGVYLAYGATLGIGGGEHFFSVRFSSLTENLDAVVDLVSDVMFNATFPQDELGKWKNQQLSALQQFRSQPAFLAQERFAAILYPGDNRSIVAPSPDSIRKITREMLLDYSSTRQTSAANENYRTT